jgi:uncharacterized membrane protein
MSTVNKNKHLVVAIYQDLTVARQAQKSIDVWDKAEESIKLGSTAVIYKGTDGRLHWERTGVKDWKKSAVVAGVAGLILGAGALVWAGIGAALGGIDTRRLGVSKEDMHAIGESLDQGKAALAVLCDDHEVAPLSAELTRLGGTITDYTVPEDVVTQTEQGVQAKTGTGQITEESTDVADYLPTTEPSARGSQTTPTPPQI